jgi:hypothetical protein
VDLEQVPEQPSPIEPLPHGDGVDFARIGIWAGVALLVGFSVWAGLRLRAEQARADAVRVAHLRALLDGSVPKWVPGDDVSRQRLWAEVRSSYASHGTHLLW